MVVREVPFLMAAGLLHIAIPVMARMAPRPSAALVARSVDSTYREIEVEVRPVPPLRPPEPTGLNTSTYPNDTEPQLLPRRRLRPQALAGATESITPDDQAFGPIEPIVPTPPVVDEYGDPVQPNRTAPGLSGPPVWMLPGVLPDRTPSRAAPTAPPPPRQTSADKAGEVLRQALRDKDKGTGMDLPAAGTVATAVANAVRGSPSPQVARATFEVRLSGAGQTLGVRVISSSAGSADEWAKIARAAAAQLAGRVLHIPAAFIKGAIIYVSIQSAMKLPSGASAGPIEQRGSGFTFDVADIGAHATRVVTSSFRAVPVE